jgi:hypothetical protein
MTATTFNSRFTVAFSVAFLISFAVVFAVTSTRNHASSSLRTNPERDFLTCQITLVDIQYDSSTTDKSTQRGEYLECSPVQDNEVSDQSYRIDLPSVERRSLLEENMERLLHGELFVSVLGGRIEGDDVILSKESIVAAVPAPTGFQSRRHLLSKTGTKSVLVLRISTNDSTPSLTANEYHQLIFADDVSLKRQYGAMSFGKLDIVPTEYGVLDLFLDTTAEGADSLNLVNLANKALKDRFNIPRVSDASDLLLMIIPPGTGNWAAYSGVGHPRSVYNDKWGGYTSSLIHEVGHGLGLGHANENGQDYTDFTSYMSAGHQRTNWPAKAFNANNFWVLGWYNDRSVSIDPVTPTLVKIAAFVDYDKTSAGEYVVAEIVVGDSNLYMQYNRAKGFNRDTEEQQDMLTIVATMDEVGSTNLVTGLDMADPTYWVPSSNLLIEVCRVNVGNGADVADSMIVSVGNGPSLCGQVNTAAPPMESKESAPTPAPSSAGNTNAEDNDEPPPESSSVSLATIIFGMLAALSLVAIILLVVKKRQHSAGKKEKPRDDPSVATEAATNDEADSHDEERPSSPNEQAIIAARQSL